MRLLRWIVILSSIAYWYSIFAMEPPLGKRPYEQEGTFWQQLDELSELEMTPAAKKEKFEELPLLELTGLTNTEELAIINKATKESTIKGSINVFDKLVFEKANSSNIETIARAIAKKFGTSYLYVLSKATAPLAKNIFDHSLLIISGPNFKDDAKQALKSGIAYNDYNSLLKMLTNHFFISAFKDDANFTQELLNFATTNKKDRAVQAILDYKANQMKSIAPRSAPQTSTRPFNQEEAIGTFIKLLRSEPEKTKYLTYYGQLRKLIVAGVPLNPIQADINPLLNAASTGNVPLVRWLLINGANPDAAIVKFQEHTTPRKVLESATSFPNKQAILELLKQTK